MINREKLISLMTYEQEEDLFPDNLIFLSYRGSVAHNMFIPSTDSNSIDDIDLIGIFMAPVDHYIGLNESRKSVDKFNGKWDVINYEFKKVVKLLLKSNPNVITLFWLNDKHYIKLHEYGKMLLDNKDYFVSKLAYKSFAGYAGDQLDQMMLVKNKRYKGYMGAKRKQLVDTYGYDPKMASHTIRLLKMGIEFLNTGSMTVYRAEDAEELLDIKKGKWKEKDIISYSNDLFSEIKKARDSSVLPEGPNYKKVNEIVKDIIMDYIIKNK